MEVHHHAHTPRRKWTHYFWEFLMLFLAVTAGFLAENIREHGIEGRREKKLMQALYSDLQTDIIQLDSLLKKRKDRNDSVSVLISILGNPGSGDPAALYYYARMASRRLHFNPQDGTLQQLRNSGGFRVVHDNEVLKSINDYEVLLKANKENVEVEEKELSDYMNVAVKVFDVRVFEEMMSAPVFARPAGAPALLTNDRLMLNELAMRLHYWKRTSTSVIQSLTNTKQKAETLGKLIRDEYHIK